MMMPIVVVVVVVIIAWRLRTTQGQCIRELEEDINAIVYGQSFRRIQWDIEKTTHKLRGRRRRLGHLQRPRHLRQC